MTQNRVFLKDCSRCGEDHYIFIEKLTIPIDDYEFYAICPILKEPILIKFIPDHLYGVEKDTNTI